MNSYFPFSRKRGNEGAPPEDCDREALPVLLVGVFLLGDVRRGEVGVGSLAVDFLGLGVLDFIFVGDFGAGDAGAWTWTFFAALAGDFGDSAVFVAGAGAVFFVAGDAAFLDFAAFALAGDAAFPLTTFPATAAFLASSTGAGTVDVLGAVVVVAGAGLAAEAGGDDALAVAVAEGPAAAAGVAVDA